MARQKGLLKLRMVPRWVVRATSTRHLFLITLAVIVITITYGTRDRSIGLPQNIGK